MATFLKAHETRNLALSVTASVIAGIATILIAGTYMSRKGGEQIIARTMAVQSGSIQIENIGDVGNIRNVKDSGLVEPKPTVSVVTNEFYNDQWNPVLVHKFYANSYEELEDLVQIHRLSDPFFNSSFDGNFNWKGAEIKLKNSIQY